MKKGLNRQIGYIKPKVNNTTPKEVAPLPKLTKEIKENVHKATEVSVDILKILEVQKTKSLKIVKWINGHKKFKWGTMCLELGIDKGNFQRVLKSNAPEIKLELIPKIEENLKQYGYE